MCEICQNWQLLYCLAIKLYQYIIYQCTSQCVVFISVGVQNVPHLLLLALYIVISVGNKLSPTGDFAFQVGDKLSPGYLSISGRGQLVPLLMIRYFFSWGVQIVPLTIMWHNVNLLHIRPSQISMQRYKKNPTFASFFRKKLETKITFLQNSSAIICFYQLFFVSLHSNLFRKTLNFLN